jgi:serine/threonine protein kinase
MIEMYPSKKQYKNAVVNGMFPFEENGGYKFLPVFENGEPIIASGGNAIVFKVKNEEGIEFAVKLFSDEIKGRFQRLIAISKYLENTQLKFFTHFKFIEKLIYVEMPGVPDEKCFFPGVLMNWINGDTLDIKLKELAQKGKRRDLKILAENFKNISQSLLENGIAHGDLKLSNILVNDKLELFLIDYDGMFVPDLVGQPAMEKGTPSYQHPRRSENDFNNTIDHFSILNIYTSLLILADNPALLEQYNDGDNIIFVKEDFDDPVTSNLFKKLVEEKIQQKLIYFLKKSATHTLINIDNIKELINGNFPLPKLIVSHTPENPFLGQNVTIRWETVNSDFLIIDGIEEKLNGSIDMPIGIQTDLSFQYGTVIDYLEFNYTVFAANPPIINYFTASNTDLKFDEPLLLSWKVENTKKVLLCFNNEKIDVTNQHEYSIPTLKSDTTFSLNVEAIPNSFTIKNELAVKVYYPIKLIVIQDLNIVFSNRPVKLKIKSKNAEQIILNPQNIDLKGKNVYELRVTESLYYKVIATNKRYSKEFESFIDVIKAPSFHRKVIEIPPIDLSLPTISIKVPTLKETLNNIASFDRKIILVNRFLNKLNFFKITTTKQKYEHRT